MLNMFDSLCTGCPGFDQLSLELRMTNLQNADKKNGGLVESFSLALFVDLIKICCWLDFGL